MWIYLIVPLIPLHAVLVSKNGAHDYGGAIYISSGVVTINRSYFSDNRVIGSDSSHGGAIYSDGSNKHNIYIYIYI